VWDGLEECFSDDGTRTTGVNTDDHLLVRKEISFFFFNSYNFEALIVLLGFFEMR
jgi:hypothetical protein